MKTAVANRPSSPTPELQLAQSRVGQSLGQKFLLEELLGLGGMGTVYIAKNLYTKKWGALKLLHGNLVKSEGSVKRLLREGSASGVVANPHIVETYDAGLLDGEPYLFMELLKGEGLDARIRRQPLFSLKEAADIAIQAAVGLSSAHRQGIVHRDIKPANLFLVEGQRPFVKVLDFGISKFLPSVHTVNLQLTEAGRLLGTPLYMPPEQINGQEDIDERVDTYALAVVLYEMLAGQQPYRAKNMMDLGAQIHNGRYTPLRALRADVPTRLEEIVAQGMAGRRDKRYSSIEDFAQALASLFELTPCPVPVSTSWYPTARGSTRPSSSPSAEPASGSVLRNNTASVIPATNALREDEVRPEEERTTRSATSEAAGLAPELGGALDRRSVAGASATPNAEDNLRQVMMPESARGRVSQNPTPIPHRWMAYLALLVVSALAAGTWWLRTTDHQGERANIDIPVPAPSLAMPKSEPTPEPERSPEPRMLESVPTGSPDTSHKTPPASSGVAKPEASDPAAGSPWKGQAGGPSKSNQPPANPKQPPPSTGKANPGRKKTPAELDELAGTL